MIILSLWRCCWCWWWEKFFAGYPYSSLTEKKEKYSTNQLYIICVMSRLMSRGDAIMIMQFYSLSRFFYSHVSFMRLTSLLNQIDLTVFFFFFFTRGRLLETVSEWPSDKVSMTKKNSSTFILYAPLFVSEWFLSNCMKENIKQPNKKKCYAKF